MSKNIIIAPVGDNINALFVGLKEFPTEKIYLLAPANYMKVAEKAIKDLERFGIPTKIIEMKGEVLHFNGKKISKTKLEES